MGGRGRARSATSLMKTKTTMEMMRTSGYTRMVSPNGRLWPDLVPMLMENLEKSWDFKIKFSRPGKVMDLLFNDINC